MNVFGYLIPVYLPCLPYIGIRIFLAKPSPVRQGTSGQHRKPISRSSSSSVIFNTYLEFAISDEMKFDSTLGILAVCLLRDGFGSGSPNLPVGPRLGEIKHD